MSTLPFLMIPSLALPVDTSPNRPIAVCLAGAPRALHLTARGIQMHLLNALGAELLAYVARGSDGWRRCTGAGIATCKEKGNETREDDWVQTLHGDAAFVELCGDGVKRRNWRFVPEGRASRDGLCALLYNSLAQGRLTALRVVDDSSLAALPVESWGDAAEFPGSWLHNSSALHQYFGHMHCFEMLKEREAVLGVPFDRVVVSRFDLQWVASHPPLAFLDSSYVWAPHADHNRGVNDRHAVLSRHHADAYFGSMQALASGHAARLVAAAALRGDLPPSAEVSAEAWLRIRLASYGIDVRLFPSVAFVRCANRGLASRSVAQCAGRFYKHSGEFHAARQTAICLAHGGLCKRKERVMTLDTVKWTESVFSGCLACVELDRDNRLCSALRATIDRIGVEVRLRVIKGDLLVAASGLDALVETLQQLPAWAPTSVVAWLPLPVPPGSGCSERFGVSAFRLLRARRVPRLIAALSTFAAMLRKVRADADLRNRKSLSSILLLHDTVAATADNRQFGRLTPRRICLLWLHAVGTHTSSRRSETSQS
eukprot:TRINITY_DN17628_c0_g2_i1.p1 TRINITY_DN17628_c0_g2~~TRINITY_DN17628_c0_g2_i1.p1  ORF type:complete len:542 (+),score=89.09 TRINITY_DN17628_c0_g2_i1:121-1746(+)